MEPILKGLEFVLLSIWRISDGPVSTLGALFALGLLFRLFYATILYPTVLTPLKQIPTPPGRSLFKGNNAPSAAAS